MTTMSGAFSVGMRGPGATCSFTVPRPSRFTGDFSAATRAFVVELDQSDGSVVTLSSFTWGELTETSGVANFEPDGTELLVAGPATMKARITLDGTIYDCKSLKVTIKADPIVP